MRIHVVSACIDANGGPELVDNEVEVTLSQYMLGEHYDKAAGLLEDGGYEEPHVHFDQVEGPKWLFAHFGLELMPSPEPGSEPA
jgi:hypothetical protein